MSKLHKGTLGKIIFCFCNSMKRIRDTSDALPKTAVEAVCPKFKNPCQEPGCSTPSKFQKGGIRNRCVKHGGFYCLTGF